MLEYDTTYYWQVKAIDGFGITTESPVWTFSTTAISPLPPPPPAPGPDPDPMPEPDPVRKAGDITGNGKIGVEDVALAMQHVVGLKVLTNEQKNVADVNGDDKIDIRDVVLIMQYALGIINSFD